MKHTALGGLALVAGAALAAQPAAANGKLTIGVSALATSVDPHFHNLGPNNQIAKHIFDNLINQDENQRLVPGLAVEWGPVDDLT
jgi:peptide/nickel transport system substrate-binding protein